MLDIIFDVAIVGSGASGALAAKRLVESGFKAVMVDVGNDDNTYRQIIPDESFTEIRRSDLQQRRFFLGENLEGIPKGGVRVGAQLTPPREFLTKDSERYLPLVSETFHPMQSLALGGLAGGYGAACFTYSENELKRIGILDKSFYEYYADVSSEIGVSTDLDDEYTPYVFNSVQHHQQALEIDSNAESLLKNYIHNKDRCMHDGLFLGHIPLAVLSTDKGERRANPYFDMDFWSDSRKSVYRPRYTVEELMRYTNFSYLNRSLVIRFYEDHTSIVHICCQDINKNAGFEIRAKRLILCAGAINSARIALNSLARQKTKVPILCNPYTYLACINLAMLGRDAKDHRHSLAQLGGVFIPDGVADELVSLQFYSYRSLLLFKLIKETPLPPWASLFIMRLLMNSFTIIGIHHSDSVSPDKFMQIEMASQKELPPLHIEFQPSEEETRKRNTREKQIQSILRKINCIPIQRISPGHASSIHYAGTIPQITDGIHLFDDNSLKSTDQGLLVGTKNVFIGDSSTWNYLPAKGSVFTIMANALRIADIVKNSLKIL